LRVPGQIVAPQSASAAISPPIAGRLIPPPGGRLPRIGDTVVAGQILASIEPAVPVSQAIELQSLEAELALRELDLETNAMQVERNIIQSHARLEYAQNAMNRAQQLKEKGVGTGQQYDKATQEIRLARSEVSAARAMKEAYEKARQRLEELRAKLTPQTSAFSAAAGTFALTMRAPIAGEIVSVAHIEGEYLDDTHQEVFRVVNLEHVWVRANISEFDLASLSQNPSATMTPASQPNERFDLLGEGGRLVYVGKVIDPADRTVSIVYEIPNTRGLFRDGMFADVYLETQVATETIAIPDRAIVMDNGKPVAFVLHDGESFIKRQLILGVRDGGFVEVKSGIAEGERVVTKGAYAVKLASVAPAEIGHGHAH
jgi:multidrug efflux pump subunit AcrA (membrane-fusion protein)